MPSRTYQTRINVDEHQASKLEAFASLFGKVERTLWADSYGIGFTKPTDFKNHYLRRFGITARHFNAVAAQLKGKYESLKEINASHITEAKQRTKKAEKVVNDLSKKLGMAKAAKQPTHDLRFKLHHKKRRLHRLKLKLEKLQETKQAKRFSLCFGSKKLFNAQHHLEANGLISHGEWQAQWHAARANQFFCLGSKDETNGNQTCTLFRNDEGETLLRLRLPDALIEDSKEKYLHFPIEFNYGQEHILKVFEQPTALSYRFQRDDKGWRVFVTVDIKPVELVTAKDLGAIGVDINVDHLAVAETDRFGNPVDSIRIPLSTYGKSTDQASALIGDAIKELMTFAECKHKPIVIEKLDFSKKKSELEVEARYKNSKRYARMLSSLAYNKVKDVIKARGFDNGIEVLEVNPAFTSVIGYWKFATRYGLSGHTAAALAIARRALNFSEKPNRRDYNATQLPAESCVHVWSYWRKVARNPRKLAVLHSLRNKTQSTLRASHVIVRPIECTGAGAPA